MSVCTRQCVSWPVAVGRETEVCPQAPLGLEHWPRECRAVHSSMSLRTEREALFVQSPVPHIELALESKLCKICSPR